MAILGIGLASCGEYARIEKSSDVALKYSYAKKYYNEKKFSKAAQLLEVVEPLYKNTAEGEQTLYLLADSYFQMKREFEATEYFRTYYTDYPKGEMAEEARFKAGYGLYLASPDPRLDQSSTFVAIQELQRYLEYYPNGTYSKEVEQYLFDLQDKLAYKEYLSAKLYYDLGLYLGNNYRASIITADLALKQYPYTKHREELQLLILEALYAEASNSVLEKLQSRFRDVADQYFNYVNEFPNGKYLNRAKKIYSSVEKMIAS